MSDCWKKVQPMSSCNGLEKLNEYTFLVTATAEHKHCKWEGVRFMTSATHADHKCHCTEISWIKASSNNMLHWQSEYQPTAAYCQIREAVARSHDVCLTRDLEVKKTQSQQRSYVNVLYHTNRACQVKHAKLNMGSGYYTIWCDDNVHRQKGHSKTLYYIWYNHNDMTIRFWWCSKSSIVEQEFVKTSMPIKIPMLWQVHNHGTTYTGWRIEYQVGFCL